MSLPSNEEWRPVSGYEGLYSVSSLGRVWTHPRGKGYPKQMPDGGIKSASRLPKGYLSVDLWADGANRRFYVHELVLTAFVGPRPSNFQACHNDGDPTNNRVENLRWDSAGENAQDQFRHGTRFFASHCRRGGHEYTPENTRFNARGAKLCIACADEYNARRRKAAA